MMFLLNRKDDPKYSNSEKAYVMDTETLTISYQSWGFVQRNRDKFVVDKEGNKRLCFGYYMREYKNICLGDVNLTSDGVQRLDFTKAQSCISLNTNLTITYKVQGQKESCLVKIKRIRGTFVPRYVCKTGKYLVSCFDCFWSKGISHFHLNNVYVVALYDTGEPRAIWGSIIKKSYFVGDDEFTKLKMMFGD